MATKDRFERLEPGGDDAASEASPARSGAQPERFREAPAEPELRVLDLDRGQGFVRCALCRQDHHATAVRCIQCGADLATRAQRAYNQDLWQRLREERAAEEPELARVRAARAQADQEDEAAQRRGAILLRQMRAERQTSWEGLDSGWVVAAATRAGHAIGGWLRRVLSARRR